MDDVFLSELSSDYDYPIFDTSSISSYYCYKKRKAIQDWGKDLVRDMQREIEKNQRYYITIEVLKESNPDGANYYLIRPGKKESFFNRLGLIEKLKQNELILDLIGGNPNLRGMFPETLRRKGYFSDLSYTDLEILLSGILLSQMAQKTAVVTNDFSIVNLWRDGVKEGHFDRNFLEVFSRISQKDPYFERSELYK